MFFPDESKSAEVFSSPDREIRVIKFTKEPGKLLGELNRKLCSNNQYFIFVHPVSGRLYFMGNIIHASTQSYVTELLQDFFQSSYQD